MPSVWSKSKPTADRDHAVTSNARAAAHVVDQRAQRARARARRSSGSAETIASAAPLACMYSVKSSMMLPIVSPSPACVVPANSPALRSRRSSSATLKPSLVSVEHVEPLDRHGVVGARPGCRTTRRRRGRRDRAAGAAVARPKRCGVEDDHHAGVRDVDADLDDRRRDEHVDFAAFETRHHRVFLLRRHPSVQAPRPADRGRPRARMSSASASALAERRLADVDRRRDDVGLAAAFDVLAHEVVRRVPCGSRG